ncbi:MAG: hypothetical protein V4598_14445 [Bdellovibrionota bacterium]
MKEATSIASILLEQLDLKSDRLVLTENAPVLKFLPPFLLKDFSPDVLTERKEFLKQYPEAILKRGHPVEIYKYLKGNEDVAFDFDQLGCVHLSRHSAQDLSENPRMRLWLNYALSPELWGPEGKWTRFHERLHKLLENHKLLEGTALPGYYPLKIQARSWETLPVEGDKTESSFNLVLPWSFSLTDLKKIESLLIEDI